MTKVLQDPLWLTMDAATAAQLDPSADVIAQLANTGWAVETLDSAPRTWVTQQCRRHGFEPRVVCSTEDLAVQLKFVEAGLGVAVLPGLALVDAGPNVRRLPTAPGMHSRSIVIVTRHASRGRPALSAVSAALSRAASQFATQPEGHS